MPSLLHTYKLIWWLCDDPALTEPARKVISEILAISAYRAVRAGPIPGPHKDPFNRMLIAQAQAENMPIISN